MRLLPKPLQQCIENTRARIYKFADYNIYMRLYLQKRTTILMKF